jgi:class 3 adenylate cyclase
MTSKGATIDVGVWLRDLGLGQYEAAFRQNEIDIDVLPELTEPHLEKLGVPLGTGYVCSRRSQIWRRVRNRRWLWLLHPSRCRLRIPLARRYRKLGERRHVTVMFCDLVDSTGIAARLDAEEWRDLVGAYVDAASTAVAEMGGKVAKKLGDGLMALFGYPVAQENDAERAVRAVLAIHRALAELNKRKRAPASRCLPHASLSNWARGRRRNGQIFGDVPYIAARAQAFAKPGTVVVDGAGAASLKEPDASHENPSDDTISQFSCKRTKDGLHQYLHGLKFEREKEWCNEDWTTWHLVRL